VNHKAARLKHHLELELKRDLPKIYGNPGSLRQLFINIIINSIYFTPEGGSIFISTEKDNDANEKRFAANSGRIRVSIRDTGKGVSAQSLAKIFDPFFTTKPIGEGTGLGLSISHKIVEEHGGSIDVESKEGRGTTFIIKLAAKIKE